MITAEQIKELRELTGVSVMQCKKALEESGGNKEKALLVLRKKSIDIAAKKGDRKLGAGVIEAYIHGNKTVGAIVELSCETDFVARNEEFVALARDIAMHVTATNPEYIDETQITDDIRAEIESRFKEEVTGSPKSKDIQTKIMEGKIGTYLKECTLLLQPFVKNSDMTVGELINSAIQKFGEKIVVTRFSRFFVEK